jgi:hypothetical protein
MFDTGELLLRNRREMVVGGSGDIGFGEVDLIVVVDVRGLSYPSPLILIFLCFLSFTR